MSATPKELAFLKAIYGSDYHDGADPVDNPVWIPTADEVGVPAPALGGIMASLVEKGLTNTDGECCSITAAGAKEIGR